MKIEKVNENIIKVTISSKDLKERNIDFNAINYNSPAAQKLFWDMMEQAESQFGFSVSDSQMIIESMPDSVDGFIITITKLNEDEDFESIQQYIRNRFKKTDQKSKKKTRRIFSAIMVYSFDTFEDICALGKKLHSVYSGQSCLYKCNDAYYVVLAKKNLTLNNLKTLEMSLSEYGKKVQNVNFIEGYLNEYGVKIIESKVFEVLNNYF